MAGLCTGPSCVRKNVGTLPESAQVVQTVDTKGAAYGVSVQEYYIFVADGAAGLIVIGEEE